MHINFGSGEETLELEIDGKYMKWIELAEDGV
jgi:hypothetical protein